LPKTGWHVAQFFQNWKVLTKPLGTSNRGWIPITSCIHPTSISGSTPHQFQVPLIKTSEENAALVTLEVTELLAKGAIVETNLSADNFVSQIFRIEKKRRLAHRDNV